MSLGSFIKKERELQFLKSAYTTAKAREANAEDDARRASLREMARDAAAEGMSWRELRDEFDEWFDAAWEEDAEAEEEDPGADDPGAEDDIDDDEGGEEEEDW